MTQPTPEHDDLLLFTPVQTAYRGANGWSAEVQRAFVGALARTGVVAVAARSVGRSPSSAYQLRRRAGPDSGFVRAWDTALARAGAEALDQAMAASLSPQPRPVFYRGRQVGWRHDLDNRLALAALRTLDHREARWDAAGINATKLFNQLTELPNEREMCEASPETGDAPSPPPCPDVG